MAEENIVLVAKPISKLEPLELEEIDHERGDPLAKIRALVKIAENLSAEDEAVSIPRWLLAAWANPCGRYLDHIDTAIRTGNDPDYGMIVANLGLAGSGKKSGRGTPIAAHRQHEDDGHVAVLIGAVIFLAGRRGTSVGIDKVAAAMSAWAKDANRRGFNRTRLMRVWGGHGDQFAQALRRGKLSAENIPPEAFQIADLL